MNLMEKTTAILSLVFHGEHHICGKIKDRDYYTEYNVDSNTFATYDFDGLTRLVVACHDYGVRVQLGSSGPRLVKLQFSERFNRSGGSMSKRHPEIEKAIDGIRSSQWYRSDCELTV